MSGKPLTLVLEKYGDQLDRSCEKRNTAFSLGGKDILHTRTTKRSKANWIGHILIRNCLLKHFIEVKIEGRKDESDGKTGKRA
jgi:hypothetical protein